VLLNKIDKKDYDKTADLYTSLISDQVLLNRKYDQYLLAASHLYELIFRSILFQMAGSSFLRMEIFSI
jgi:hypothetical protein